MGVGGNATTKVEARCTWQCMEKLEFVSVTLLSYSLCRTIRPFHKAVKLSLGWSNISCKYDFTIFSKSIFQPSAH